MPNTTSCKNCDQPFDASYDYCPHCGQEATDNLTFGVLFSNTIENYFSIDARFFRSFVPLMLKPGVLARRFVDGKRLKYLHPAQFYLFISVIFFFLFSFTVSEADNEFTSSFKRGLEKATAVDTLLPNKDSLELEAARDVMKKSKILTAHMSEEELQQVDSIITASQSRDKPNFIFNNTALDSLILAGASEEEKLKVLGLEENADAFTRKMYSQGLKIYEQRAGGVLKTLYDTVPIAMFLMLPLFAVLLKLFYWRRGTFAHHMVFSFYFFTFLFTSFCIIILMNKLVGVPLWIEVLIFFSFVIYLLIALRNFYRSSWFGAFFKSGAIAFLYMILIVPIAIIGLVFASFLLY